MKNDLRDAVGKEQTACDWREAGFIEKKSHWNKVDKSKNQFNEHESKLATDFLNTFSTLLIWFEIFLNCLKVFDLVARKLTANHWHFNATASLFRLARFYLHWLWVFFMTFWIIRNYFSKTEKFPAGELDQKVGAIRTKKEKNLMVQSIFHHTRSHYSRHSLLIYAHFLFISPNIQTKSTKKRLVPLCSIESRLCHRTRIFLIIEEIKGYFMKRSKTFV